MRIDFCKRMRQLTLVLLFAACGPFVSPSYSQFGDTMPQGISTYATHSIPLKPEKLRLEMWVKAQGATSKAAIVELAKHRDRVRTELATMKADPASILFSATRVQEGDGNSGEQRAAMMQVRAMNQSNWDDVIPETPKVFTAMCALRCEWQLPVQEGDAVAILPSTLLEQISARDLAGNKNKPALTEEEQERAEEMAAAMQESYGYFEHNDDKKPKIVYVAAITEDIKQQANAAAYKVAAAEAKTLSAATGIAIGKLKGISNRANSDLLAPRMSYSPYLNEASLTPASFGLTAVEEMSSESLDNLTYTIDVVVCYEIGT